MAAPPSSDERWFRKLQPGEVPPPPPAELVAWANNTLMATLVGTLYGGARAHATREPPSPDVHPQVTLQRHLIRVARGTATTGFQAGAFAAVFLGTQAYLEHKRGAGNWQHAAAAGGFTAGLLGLLMPSGAAARLQGLAAGACVGAGVAAPLGMLQAELQARLAAEGAAQPAAEAAARPKHGAAAHAAIQALEASLGDGKR